MANELLSGVGGTISLGGTPAHIRKWTIRQVLSTVSANSSTTAGVTKRFPVNSSWEGTCSIYLVDGAVDKPAEILNRTTGPVAFIGGTGHATKSCRGNVIITGIDVDTDVEEGAVLTAEVTFEGTDALTFAAA